MIARIRAILLLSTWGIGLALLGPFCILATIVTKREEFITVPATMVVRLGLLLGRVEVETRWHENVDPRGTYVITPNHQSNLDPPLVWLAFGTPRHRPAFLLKKELMRVPLFGTGVKNIGMIEVDRSNRERAIKSAAKATEVIHGGRSFVVFPEGTRTRTGGVLPFKKGAFHMAVAAGVPVVPVTIDGTFRAMPKGRLALERVPIRITIHEPIPTAGLREEDIPALIARTHETIASALPLMPQPTEQGA